MPQIKVLPQAIAELIAAGEVVEKPASVIKELTENAIDAGATDVTVEIKGGGVLYMRVSDNGCGIPPREVPTAFLRHATSKIVAQEDLDSIATLGFRGEALAAISAVSRVELLTRTMESETGTRYVIEGGVEQSMEEVGCPAGTTITVRDLFYNTPARMKFLHKDVFEANVVIDVLEHIALSHPEIRLTAIRDGKTVFTTPGNGKLADTVYSVLGREFAATLLPVEETVGAIHIAGLVCKPVHCRPKRNAQYFFLNGRTIRSGTCAAALEAAYKNAAMIGKFPACVLQIDLPVGQVDVNVHPAKTEVRFSNDKPVFDAVYFAVKNALHQHDTVPELAVKKPTGTGMFSHMTVEEYRQSAIQTPEKAPAATPVSSGEPVRVMRLNDYRPEREEKATSGAAFVPPRPTVPPTPFVPDAPVSSLPHENEPSAVPAPGEEPTASAPQTATPFTETGDLADRLRYVGEVFKTYVLAEDEDRLFFIDKHAAHERILFERLKADTVPQTQELLWPVTVKLPPADYTAVLEQTALMNRAGFDLEDFGNGCVVVRGIPAALTGEDVTSVVSEAAANLAGRHEASNEALDRIFHTVACKAAIKAGYDTTKEELLYLAKEVLSRDDVRYCPHGRPVIFEVKKRDLEKQFGRIQG